MRRSVLLLCLVLAALLGAMAVTPWLTQAPALRDSSDSGQFDARQAKARLAFILGDQRPHPSDTPASDQVRGRLIEQLRQLGLQPIVRDQFACNELYKERGVSCARVRNVIAALGPGTGKALLLDAHYDSTPVGPGAGDDGIGVATLLEVARHLKDQPLKRPVILLFNEGEELGLIGARAFLADPLSRNVDSLINLEARGVRGPANMFETSRPNGAAISVFSKAVERPVANSLSTDVYRLLPNYTDVNSFSERGWLTLNIAPIGNETRYHSPGDDIAALDPRTLQHMGDQVLALSRELTGDPHARANPDERIFMDVAGRGLIVLPMAAGIVLLAGLLLAFAWIGWKRGGLLRGTGVVLGAIVGATTLAWIALALIAAVRAGIFWRAHPVWAHLTAYASAMLAAGLLIASLGARLDRTQLRAAFWLAFLVIGAAMGWIAPGGIIFFIGPPLIVVTGVLLSRYWRPAERIAAWLAILFLYFTWGAMLGLLEELLNGGPMWVFAPLGMLIVLPVLIEVRPLIVGAGPRITAVAAGALALAAWAGTAAAPAYSADRQQRFVLQSVTSAGKSFWSVVNDGAPLPDNMLGLAKWQLGKIPLSERKSWFAPAPTPEGLKPPTIALVDVSAVPAGRRVRFKVQANGALAFTLAAPENAQIRTAGVSGFVRPIDAKAESGRYDLSCFGRSCDGATMEFTTASKQPLVFTLSATTPGLPPNAAGLAAARPPNSRPQYLPDATISISQVRL